MREFFHRRQPMNMQKENKQNNLQILHELINYKIFDVKNVFKIVKLCQVASHLSNLISLRMCTTESQTRSNYLSVFSRLQES